MSTAYNDLLVSSNNSINDNKINAKKARSTAHQLKRLLRPLMALLKSQKSNTYKKSMQPDLEIEQNNANELLEARIFEEVDSCEDFSAVPVYNEGHMDILEVFRGQRYIPVNFARTEAGTFFWTSVVGPDCDIPRLGDANPITNYQTPEIQVACDRWAQA